MPRTVFITGCSTGFGNSLARRLARRGDRVYATMRNVDGRNREAAESLRGLAEAEDLTLRVLEVDVTSDADVERAAATVLEEGSAPDVVVNNAGQMFVGVTEAYTSDELAHQLDINIVGTHRVSRAFLPAMREAGAGLIVNVSSVAGRVGIPFFGVYHASKWAVEGYSLGLRRELAHAGIDVVVVEPGPFSTELFPRAPAPADEDGRSDTYDPVLHETFQSMGDAFEGLLADEELTDPEQVVDRMIELMDMAPGARPFRSVVGVDFGLAARNQSDEAHDPPMLEALGLTDFTRLSTVGRA